jgi:hypothetical protein
MSFMLSKTKHRKVCVNKKHFSLIFDLLYKKSDDRILRRCVNYHEVASILEACHDNACVGHFFGHLIT